MKFNDLIEGTFRNDNQGGSARKFSAFECMALYACLMVLYGFCVAFEKVWATAIFLEVLIVNLSAAAFFLGLISVANLIALRTGKTETTHNETTTTIDTSTSSTSQLQNNKDEPVA